MKIKIATQHQLITLIDLKFYDFGIDCEFTADFSSPDDLSMGQPVMLYLMDNWQLPGFISARLSKRYTMKPNYEKLRYQQRPIYLAQPSPNDLSTLLSDIPHRLKGSQVYIPAPLRHYREHDLTLFQRLVKAFNYHYYYDPQGCLIIDDQWPASEPLTLTTGQVELVDFNYQELRFKTTKLYQLGQAITFIISPGLQLSFRVTQLSLAATAFEHNQAQVIGFTVTAKKDWPELKINFCEPTSLRATRENHQTTYDFDRKTPVNCQRLAPGAQVHAPLPQQGKCLITHVGDQAVCLGVLPSKQIQARLTAGSFTITSPDGYGITAYDQQGVMTIGLGNNTRLNLSLQGQQALGLVTPNQFHWQCDGLLAINCQRLLLRSLTALYWQHQEAVQYQMKNAQFRAGQNIEFSAENMRENYQSISLQAQQVTVHGSQGQLTSQRLLLGADKKTIQFSGKSCEFATESLTVQVGQSRLIFNEKGLELYAPLVRFATTALNCQAREILFRAH